MPVLITPPPSQRLQSASLFLLGLGAAVALLYFGRAFWITLVVAVILSFILDPFVTLVMKPKLPRGFASFIVCSVALLILYFSALGLYSELGGLADDLPTYSKRANDLVNSVADRFDRMEQNAYMLLVPQRLQDKDRIAQAQLQIQQNENRKRKRPAPVNPALPPPIPEVRIHQDRTSLISYTYSYLSEYYHVLLMISFVPFLVYFMLSWSDHIRRSFLILFEGSDRIIAGKTWQSIADVARAYAFGNFLLGLLLTAASCACFWSWHLPYWVLLGAISGFLSLVPYVGLPLAMVPPLIGALTTYAALSPYFIISATVAFLHLLALNLLYPQIVGARVHLNPLTVTVALMFWGTIWGGIGLLLAIPITAGVKAVFDNIEDLQPYGKLLGD